MPQPNLEKLNDNDKVKLMLKCHNYCKNAKISVKMLQLMLQCCNIKMIKLTLYNVTINIKMLKLTLQCYN